MNKSSADGNISTFQEQWEAVCRRLKLGNEITRAGGNYLIEAYGHPARHYHGLGHICDMLQTIDVHEDRFIHADSARLAVFFHDAVYDPLRSDNEARSAEAMLEMLSITTLAETELLSHAHAMVMATQSHKPSDADTNLFLDIDMQVLGAPWTQYREYALGIMREYMPHYGEAAYRTGRAQRFLQPTLARPTLFLTSTFVGKNAQAHANLRREEEILASEVPLEEAFLRTF